MWQTIVKYAVKLAVYAADHPDQVKAAVDLVVKAKEKK